MHWVEFWLHAGCRLRFLGLLGMLLEPFWEHFGSEVVAQRLDFEGPGLNLGFILHAF